MLKMLLLCVLIQALGFCISYHLDRIGKLNALGLTVIVVVAYLMSYFVIAVRE